MTSRTSISNWIFLGAVFAAALCAWMFPASAHACSAPACKNGYTLPHGGQVPGGVDALLWVPQTGAAVTQLSEIDASDVEVVKVEDDQETPVTLTLGRDEQDRGILELRLDQPLEPESTYKIYTRDFCDSDATATDVLISTLQTGPSAAHPDELGELVAGDASVGDLDVATDVGSCNLTIGAVQMPVEVSLSAEAAAWKDMFRYRTFVRSNGEEAREWWPTHSLVQSVPVGESWEGRGKDLLYSMCSPPEHGDADDVYSGLEEGTHEVFMRASIPGTDVSLETEPVQFVLDCDGESGEVDGGVGVGDDTGSADVGPDADAGSGGDAELNNQNSPEGCACSVDGRRAGPAGALGLFLIAGLAFARRSRD